MSQTGYLHPVAGSFSRPADGNPTGVLMEAAFHAAGIRAHYVNCEVAPEGLAAAVAGARAMGWRGFNCSMPHKVAVMAELDGIGPSAAAIGAVNCVRRDGDRLIGENTDGRGFVSSLRTLVDPAGACVVVLGSGGAARAIAVELGLAGAAEIVIVARNEEAAASLADAVAVSGAAHARVVPWTPGVRLDPTADVIVNATSVGMDGASAPEVSFDGVRGEAIIGDVVIAADRTPFLRAAEERGLAVLDGLGMLVDQAVLSLEYWFGVDPDAARMRSALEDELRGR
jgi:shikimate dehydrogenase